MKLAGLATRDTDISELMDDPDCDPVALRRTYAQFRVVNRLLARWRLVYRRHIRALLAPDTVTTLLDVGCGGGDVARSLLRWADRDGLRLAVTAIDPDERAYTFATAQAAVDGLTFRRATSGQLLAEGASFDIVTSNHLLHHLDPAGLAALLDDSARLARRLVVHNDLCRSRGAYLAYAVVSRPWARRSFVHVDGLLSIRRSYRPTELQQIAGEEWRVSRALPARLLLTTGTSS